MSKGLERISGVDMILYSHAPRPSDHVINEKVVLASNQVPLLRPLHHQDHDQAWKRLADFARLPLLRYKSIKYYYNVYDTGESKSSLRTELRRFGPTRRSPIFNVSPEGTSSNRGSQVFWMLRHTAIRDPHASDQNDHTTPVQFSSVQETT